MSWPFSLMIKNNHYKVDAISLKYNFLIIIIREMLVDALKAIVNNPFKKRFMGKEKKK